ncbi:IS5 family transposase [Pacificimonas pallii]|uniref:IS5 family transposase n=1 Tax=Pacificimonas pallii TaxID=2827236 RepID=UPI003F71D330
MIDSTSVRTHQQAATVKRDRDHRLGRSRGGLSTKIHAVVDGKGLPIRPSLSAGQSHDALPDHVGEETSLLADNKTYDANRIRVSSRETGERLPKFRPRPTGDGNPTSAQLYRERSLIERFVSKLKHVRHVTTRYGKFAENSLAVAQLASMRP